MPDSALLAALDDALVIKPDVINLSLGDDSGMSSDAGSVFAGVYEKLAAAGITVNAAGGNAFSNAYGNNSGQNKPSRPTPTRVRSANPPPTSPPWLLPPSTTRRPCHT